MRPGCVDAAGSVCLVAAVCVGAAGSGCSIAAVCVGAAGCVGAWLNGGSSPPTVRLG